MKYKIPANDVKLYVARYESIYQKVVNDVRNKNVTWESLDNYKEWYKLEFLFSVIPVGAEHTNNLNHIRFKYGVSPNAIRNFFEIKIAKEYVIVEQDYFNEIEKFSDTYK